MAVGLRVLKKATKNKAPIPNVKMVMTGFILAPMHFPFGPASAASAACISGAGGFSCVPSVAGAGPLFWNHATRSAGKHRSVKRSAEDDAPHIAWAIGAQNISRAIGMRRGLRQLQSKPGPITPCGKSSLTQHVYVLRSRVLLGRRRLPTARPPRASEAVPAGASFDDRFSGGAW